MKIILLLTFAFSLSLAAGCTTIYHDIRPGSGNTVTMRISRGFSTKEAICVAQGNTLQCTDIEDQYSE